MEEGIRTYTCSACGESYTETIAKLPMEDTEDDSDDEDEPMDDPADKPAGDGDMEQPAEEPGDDSDDEDEDDDDEEAPYLANEKGIQGWDAILDILKNAKTGDIVTIHMNGTTKVIGDVFNAIKGRNVTVVFDMGNEITWRVNGKEVTAANVSDIDFGVELGSKDKPLDTIPVEVVNKLTGERYYVNVSLVYDGEFGFVAILSVNVGAGNAGLFANLYYYNEQTKKYEFICADEINKNGVAELVFTHASEYTIVIDKQAAVTSPKTGDTSSDIVVMEVQTDIAENASQTNTWIVLIGVVILISGVGALVLRRKEQNK